MLSKISNIQQKIMRQSQKQQSVTQTEEKGSQKKLSLNTVDTPHKRPKCGYSKNIKEIQEIIFEKHGKYKKMKAHKFKEETDIMKKNNANL